MPTINHIARTIQQIETQLSSVKNFQEGKLSAVESESVAVGRASTLLISVREALSAVEVDLKKICVSALGASDNGVAVRSSSLLEAQEAFGLCDKVIDLQHSANQLAAAFEQMQGADRSEPIVEEGCTEDKKRQASEEIDDEDRKKSRVPHSAGDLVDERSSPSSFLDITSHQLQSASIDQVLEKVGKDHGLDKDRLTVTNLVEQFVLEGLMTQPIIDEPESEAELSAGDEALDEGDDIANAFSNVGDDTSVRTSKSYGSIRSKNKPQKMTSTDSLDKSFDKLTIHP